MKEIPKAVCSFIINDEGLVLAVSRKENHSIFGLPGGKVEVSDLTIEDAAKRELIEETGVLASGGVPICTSLLNKKTYLTTTFIWNKLLSEPKQIEGEGLVAWVSPDVMCQIHEKRYENFGIYNRKLFNLLGFEVKSNYMKIIKV